MYKNYTDPIFNQLNLIIDDLNKKCKNLNNRLRRIENFLALRADDKFDDDLFN